MNSDELLKKLHDIKPLVQIPDNSFFIFLALILCASLLVLILIFFIIKFFKNRKISERKKHYNILQNIDFKNPKQNAYTITKYANLLAKSQREKKLCFELDEELEKYKYKKEVQDFDKNTKQKFSTFMDSLDV